MKDRIRYSEAFKLKVMEELRDAKWKSVKEAATAVNVEMLKFYWSLGADIVRLEKDRPQGRL